MVADDVSVTTHAPGRMMRPAAASLRTGTCLTEALTEAGNPARSAGPIGRAGTPADALRSAG